ncbi:hypothetical protein QMO56_20080 [Roseomonas sp. E05]|uniref:hypothetical protein n=1 Tax=Roseomonas sp. E05 TaxID=3046310 RepID=UPI0024B9EC29|nr:hypothetical protein [Roseomonas sp. E05]MDJ0390417.1 hypothetical protein [Roseomonas sp. E05]
MQHGGRFQDAPPARSPAAPQDEADAQPVRQASMPPSALHAALGPAPEPSRRSSPALNFRAVSERRAAAWSETLEVRDLRRRTDMESAVTVPASTHPLDYWVFYGQSNAGMSGSAGTNVITGAWWPHHALQFAGCSAADGKTLLDGARLVDFAPISPSSALGQPAWTAPFAAEAFFRERTGTASPGRVTFTTNYAGHPITSMMPGSVVYTNMLTAASRAKAIAEQYGRALEISRFVFIQGETFSSGYGTDLAILADAARADLQAITGQAAPQMLLVQTNGPDVFLSPSYIQLEQYRFCRERYGRGVTMVGPMYAAPFAANDIIHQDGIGKAMLGQAIAYADDALRAGEEYQPLWPLLDRPVSRSGNQVTVRFSRPVAFDPGLGNGGWVKPVENYGFAYFGADSSRISITSVAITAECEVTIMLSGTPMATDRRIGYARCEPASTEKDGWTGTRGQLISPTGRKSPFHAAGAPIPAQIDLYCVQFEEPIP